jgi:ribokinase
MRRHSSPGGYWTAMETTDAVVVGQIARDLVLTVDEVPEAQGTRPVRSRREMLGGKGANQAVGLRQLGIPAALCGVVGDDEVAGHLLAQAARDGVDVRSVVRRPGTATGLIVDIVTADGRFRYLEDLPEGVLLTEPDVARAAPAIGAARAVLVQLQQPSAAALAAARLARGLVVLDGAPADDERRDALLDAAGVVRADDREAAALAGTDVSNVDSAIWAGRALVERGIGLVALAVPGAGNVFVHPHGAICLPLVSDTVVDTTGAGDALIAGLVAALLRDEPPEVAARYASAAAAATVGHPGGRPDLSEQALAPYLARLADAGVTRR